MQVIINNEEFNWLSDYDDGWMRSSGDDFKFPVLLGDRHSCFIKRFARAEAEVSGWRFVQALRTNHQPGLARVLDIVQTEESGIAVRYLFYECMKGDTLDKKIKDQYVPHSRRFLGDMLKALRSMHRLGYWMSDFCEKNVFCKSDEAYSLIDLDSVHPTAARPDNLMYGDKGYWSKALSYLSHQAGLDGLRPQDVPGPVLNYLQVALLMVRIRVGLELKEEDYQSTALQERLPELLDETIPEFRGVFAGLVRNEVEVLSEDDIDQIKELLVERVVNGERGDHRDQGKKYDGGRRQDRRPPVRPPVIRRFSSDKKRLSRGGAFTLSWEIEDGEKVVIYRNGVAYSEAANGLGAMTLTERFDGKERTVDYSLEVSNSAGSVVSEPVLSIHIGTAFPISRKLVLLVAGGLVAAVLLVLGSVKAVNVLRERSFERKEARIRDSVNKKDSIGRVPPPPPVDPRKHYEDSINRRRDSINRRQDSIKKVNATSVSEGKKPPKDPKLSSRPGNTTQGSIAPKTDTPKHITEPVHIRDTAAERRLVESNLKKDSVRIVDTFFAKKIAGIKVGKKSELWVHNLSGYKLETVKVLIIPNKGTSDEREVYGIPAKGYQLLLGNIPKGGIQSTTIMSVAIKLP